MLDSDGLLRDHQYSYGEELNFNVFDNLTSRHPDGKLHPAWPPSGSPATTTWDFKLRPGVKFHNGDPFTSADVKFTIERTYDPERQDPGGHRLHDDRADRGARSDTVVIHTKKPDPLLPARLAFYGGQIVPKKYLEQVGPDTFNAKPVGTGP